jgi:hypothetical protein
MTTPEKDGPFTAEMSARPGDVHLVKNGEKTETLVVAPLRAVRPHEMLGFDTADLDGQ